MEKLDIWYPMTFLQFVFYHYEYSKKQWISIFKDQVLAIVQISTPEPQKRSIHSWEKIFLDTGKFLIFTKDTDFSKKIKMNYTSQDLETFSKLLKQYNIFFSSDVIQKIQGYRVLTVTRYCCWCFKYFKRNFGSAPSH